MSKLITRRNMLVGLLAAPAVIKIPDLLMPIKSIETPYKSNFIGISLSEDTALAIGENGSIQISRDYGLTWEEFKPNMSSAGDFL